MTDLTHSFAIIGLFADSEIVLQRFDEIQTKTKSISERVIEVFLYEKAWYIREFRRRFAEALKLQRNFRVKK